MECKEKGFYFLSYVNKPIYRDFSQAYLGTNPEIPEGNKSAFLDYIVQSVREISDPPCPKMISFIWLNTCFCERGFAV